VGKIENRVILEWYNPKSKLSFKLGGIQIRKNWYLNVKS
jgi:hypothetical protein